MVRRLLVHFVLITGLIAGATAGAAPRVRRVVVILPPAGEGEDGDLALAMQTRASTLLVRGGGFQDIHLKQILAAADREGLTRASLAAPDVAAVMGRRFGAERVVYATLVKQAGGWLLTASVGRATRKIKLPGGPAAAVEQGALALARLAADGPIKPSPAPTSSDGAMTPYARCYAIVAEQPLLIDTPMVLEEDRVKQAVADCRTAVAADPQFKDALAALGLALALQGEDEAAVEALARIKEDSDYLPLYWLGRYWLVTRYQSPDKGVVALKKAIERHPYFLLARGYLAQHESVIRRDAAALEDWKAYQKELPRSAFVAGGKSHSLARLGKHADAIAEATAAVTANPDDDAAKLELGSRHVDAGNNQKAIEILLPLAGKPNASSETMLRLGYAYTRVGDSTNADKWLTKAETTADRPRQWRTRARARLDRGVMLVKAGRTDEGQALLVSAKRGGLSAYIEAQKDEELKRMVAAAEVAQRDRKVTEFQIRVPKETSPFLTDGANDIGVPGRPPPAPKMFEVLRF